MPEVVRTVLKQEIARLFGDSNPQSFNKKYLSQHSNSIPHRLAGTKHTLRHHTHTLHSHSPALSGGCLKTCSQRILFNNQSSLT